MEKTIVTQHSRSVPLRIRLTEVEYKQLKILAYKENKPVATVAYALLVKALQHHS